MICSCSNFLLIFSIISSFLSIFNKSPLAKYLLISHGFAVITSFCLLVLGFLISDFSIQNVFLNSSSITPLIFKISGAWASHEGSLLLWLCFINIISLSIIYKGITDYRTLGLTLFLLSSFLYYFSNPFINLSISPHQGMGLNPSLQDYALAIHPPILFLGNAIYIAPFILSIHALLNTQNSLKILKPILSYSKKGWMLLTLGIGIGSWWAYRELGWGGYWFFDPVENISLIPLMLAIAYHHSLIFTCSNGNLIKWTIFLGINIFPLTLLCTFFVRSGLIISIHAFADSKNIEFLLAIFFIIFLLPNILFYKKFASLQESKIPSLSKMQGIVIGNWIWIIAVCIILLSLIYPIIYSLLGHQIMIEMNFFILYFLPLFIPIIILAGTFAYFKATITNFMAYYISAILAFILSILIFYSLKLNGVLIFLMLISSIFLMISTILKLIEKSEYFTIQLSKKMRSMLIGHFGLGLLVISILLNNILKQEIDFIGKIGDSITKNNYKITLKNIVFLEELNYYKQNAEFWVEKPNGEIILLHPENRLYKIENSLTTKTSISNYLTYDIYCVLNKIDAEVIHAKIYYQPFINFIWISILIIIIALI